MMYYDIKRALEESRQIESLMIKTINDLKRQQKEIRREYEKYVEAKLGEIVASKDKLREFLVSDIRLYLLDAEVQFKEEVKDYIRRIHSPRLDYLFTEISNLQKSSVKIADKIPGYVALTDATKREFDEAQNDLVAAQEAVEIAEIDLRTELRKEMDFGSPSLLDENDLPIPVVKPSFLKGIFDRGSVRDYESLLRQQKVYRRKKHIVQDAFTALKDAEEFMNEKKSSWMDSHSKMIAAMDEHADLGSKISEANKEYLDLQDEVFRTQNGDIDVHYIRDYCKQLMLEYPTPVMTDYSDKILALSSLIHVLESKRNKVEHFVDKFDKMSNVAARRRINTFHPVGTERDDSLFYLTSFSWIKPFGDITEISVKLDKAFAVMAGMYKAMEEQIGNSNNQNYSASGGHGESRKIAESGGKDDSWGLPNTSTPDSQIPSYDTASRCSSPGYD